MPLLIQELNGEVHPVGNNIVITNDSFAKLEKKKTSRSLLWRDRAYGKIFGKELRKNKVSYGK